jgi:hypothetical protein
LIAPTAKCVVGLNDGQLSLETIRQKFRPIGDLLEQITLGYQDDESMRNEFWSHFVKIPIELQRLNVTTKDFGCTSILEEYQYGIGDTQKFPMMYDYRHLPYLYVASALLMHFLQDDDVALQILRKNRTTANPDALYWKLLASFNYYQGRDTDEVVEPLEKWHLAIESRLEKIRDCQCDREKQKRMHDREARNEIIMMNNYGYYVSEDLARGVKSAEQFAATAQDYLLRIKRAVDTGDAAAGDSDDKDDFLDTYAYGTIVMEARKSTPEVETFREMSHLLAELVEHYERKLRDRDPTSDSGEGHLADHFDAAALKAVRVHYAAARELAGE